MILKLVAMPVDRYASVTIVFDIIRIVAAVGCGVINEIHRQNVHGGVDASVCKVSAIVAHLLFDRVRV